jgi:hypothetical protein
MATVESHDLLPVRSRVSWGAIVAGAFTALAVYLLLWSLGAALGLSFVNNVSDQTLGVGAGIWAVATTLLALFLGGWVASQCTAGENKLEAIIYGVVVWGVFFGILMWLMASGVRMGFNALMGVASTPAVSRQITDEDLRASGFTPAQITDMREQFDKLGTQVREVAADPRASTAAWWTFAGILFSMAAAVVGSVLGSGPTLMLAALRVRSTTVAVSPPRETTIPR